MAKRGRKPKTVADLPDNWKEIVILLSLEGKFEEQIKTALCLSKGREVKSINRIWYALQERDSEFRETLKKADVFRKSYWLDLAQKGVRTTFFNTGLWFIVMKNCFGWKDKTEVDHGLTDNFFDKFVNLTKDDLLKKFNELISRKLK